VKEATKELKALVNREPFEEKKALNLIQLGAYVEVRNNDTQTLLHLTAKNGCIHCIEELIKA
jgi:ankyrin repeat protein